MTYLLYVLVGVGAIFFTAVLIFAGIFLWQKIQGRFSTDSLTDEEREERIKKNREFFDQYSKDYPYRAIVNKSFAVVFVGIFVFVAAILMIVWEGGKAGFKYITNSIQKRRDSRERRGRRVSY